MAIEAMKGAGMSYAGSSSASDVKAESQAKVETASNTAASELLTNIILIILPKKIIIIPATHAYNAPKVTLILNP